ncbi:hypothetical protein LG314_12690 [Agrococcus terreus]|uniref:hypothetical protein n=1 Tax=Agrococcus terreus TaxID=574649 RepID=UPI00384F57D4
MFEIAVLLRISMRLAGVGDRVDGLRLLDAARGPFASYRLATGRIVRVWYQRWPPSSGFSELRDAVKYYEVGEGGTTKPDVAIEFVDHGIPTRLVLLELKASTSSSYVASGFSQLLSYLRERPSLTGQSPSGWLVSPHPTGQLRDPEGRALWSCSADDVASAVVATALSGSPVSTDGRVANQTGF